MDNPKSTEAERKTSPEKEKRVTFPVPVETPECEPRKPSTSTQDNTPVRKLKKKRQEDKDEEDMIKPKKMKTHLKECSTSMAQQDETLLDGSQTKNIERKPSFPRKKKQKQKHVFHEAIESSESEPAQPSTSTLKRKRQEDKEEEETMELKKRKTTLKDSTSSDAKRIAASEKTERDDLITDKDKFEGKYVEEYYFAAGGYGSIYEGFRKSDNLPVAIKHILKRKIPNKEMDDGNGRMVPSEVAMMLMLRDESIHSDGKAAPVALLDWYDIDREILLVMERPIPCEDLRHYITSKGGKLQEEEAKIIMKQLIRTAIDLEDRNIFHQDIKTDNILIQTHTKTPQARLIDFGVSCMAEKDSILRGFSGTPINAPPEAFKGFCSPGSSTVWQLGVVLYETLHYCNDFSTKHFLKGDQMIDKELSEECQDFFHACLNTAEEQCPYLQDVLHHPWLG